MADITFKIGDQAGQLVLDNIFANDMPVNCPLTLTVDKDESQNWLKFFENDGGRENWTLKWNPDSNSDAGEYDIVLNVEGLDSEVTASESFKLIVEPSCDS